jgi:hypothetical protein
MAVATAAPRIKLIIRQKSSKIFQKLISLLESVERGNIIAEYRRAKQIFSIGAALIFEGAAVTFIRFIVFYQFILHAIDDDSILHAWLPLLFEPSEYFLDRRISINLSKLTTI